MFSELQEAQKYYPNVIPQMGTHIRAGLEKGLVRATQAAQKHDPIFYPEQLKSFDPLSQRCFTLIQLNLSHLIGRATRG